MKLKNIIFFLKKLKKKLGLDTFSIVSCTVRDPSPRDFSLMTLVPELVVGFGEQDSKKKRILAIVELRG